jgi:hypothetical protein
VGRLVGSQLGHNRLWKEFPVIAGDSSGKADSHQAGTNDDLSGRTHAESSKTMIQCHERIAAN